jgi:hypothetical protein
LLFLHEIVEQFFFIRENIIAQGLPAWISITVRAVPHPCGRSAPCANLPFYEGINKMKTARSPIPDYRVQELKTDCPAPLFPYRPQRSPFIRSLSIIIENQMSMGKTA